MTQRLRVHLGRDGPKSVEIEETSIEVSDDFTVEIHNHGHPQHVHVAPERDLGRFVRVEAPNHFIEADDARVVTVEVAEERPQKFDGKLRFVTGYGTETAYVDVRLREEQPAEPSVAVDDSLSRPQTDPPEPSLSARAIDPDSIPVVALATMALLIAVGATMIATDVAVVLGVIAVLVGVGIAVVLVLR